MSFSFYNTSSNNAFSNNQNDVRNNYEKLGEEFCKYYYSMFDQNFPGLSSIYIQNPCITFQDDKFASFEEFNRRMHNEGIWSFTHHEIKGNSQPVGQDGLLVTVTGTLSKNASLVRHRFKETVLLHRDGNNRFFIHNSIFKILD